MVRVTADTNVLVSAIIANGPPRRFLEGFIEGNDTLLLSNAILQEFLEVLRRPKFALEEERVQQALFALLAIAELVQVRSKHPIVKEDPDDDAIMHTAIDGRAEVIVTGDSHLLVLEQVEGIRILRVSDFLKQYR